MLFSLVNIGPFWFPQVFLLQLCEKRAKVAFPRLWPDENQSCKHVNINNRAKAPWIWCWNLEYWGAVGCGCILWTMQWSVLLYMRNSRLAIQSCHRPSWVERDWPEILAGCLAVFKLCGFDKMLESQLAEDIPIEGSLEERDSPDKDFYEMQ